MALDNLADMANATSQGFTWFGDGVSVLMQEPFIYGLGFLFVALSVRIGIGGIKRICA